MSEKMYWFELNFWTKQRGKWDYFCEKSMENIGIIHETENQ